MGNGFVILTAYVLACCGQNEMSHRARRIATLIMAVILGTLLFYSQYVLSSIILKGNALNIHQTLKIFQSRIIFGAFGIMS